MLAGGVEFNKTLDQGIGNSFWKPSYQGQGVVGHFRFFLKHWRSTRKSHMHNYTHKAGTGNFLGRIPPFSS
jgi:hypothetical protein